MLEIFSSIIQINIGSLLILLTGIAGGFVSGFLGTGCGIIITPLLMDLGLPPFTAIATQLCHATGTNFTSFLVYKRKTDVDFLLGFYILIGGCIGAFFEWIFLKCTTNPQVILQKFMYLYIAILGIFGFVTIYQSFQTRESYSMKKTKYRIMMRKWMMYLPRHKILGRSRTEMSIIVPILLGFFTSILVASLGGGSNLFMAPILTYLIGRISSVVYGTVSMVSFIITALVALIYSSQSYCCDIHIVLLLFVGASFGSWCGVKLTYKVSRYYINIISGIVMLCMAGKQLYKIFSPQVYANQQVLTSNSIPIPPIKYTFICILILTIIAYFYERILEKISKTRWFRH